MDPTVQSLLGIQQYPSDDPVNGIVPPQPNPAHITPQQLEIMHRVGQPLWDAGSKVMSAIASDPVVRYQTAAHQAIGTVLGDKLKSAWDTVTYPMHNQMPPSFADTSDPRTQGAIANAASVAQRLISPAGAFRPRPGVVGSGAGGVGPGGPPDAIGPLMQKAPWSAPSVEPQGILGYHGSPHHFNEFDMSKIGTGEGAQVYGHGLYTAGREGVARSYRDALTDKTHPDPATNIALKSLAAGRSDDEVASTLGLIFPGNSMASIRSTIQAAKDYKPNKGSMYEVNIKHDPEHMLDWDKPINEQPEVFKKLQDQGWIDPHEVEMRKEWGERTKNSRNRPLDALQDWFSDLGQQKIAALRADDRGAERDVQKKIDVIMGWWDHQIKNPREKIDPSAYPTGEAFYKHMTDQHDTPAGASEALKDMGIPGIRYLDAGSRGGGEGSRNYVSFDDKSMEILRKYGIAGLMSSGAAGAAAVNNLRDYAGSNEQQNKQALQWLQQGGM